VPQEPGTLCARGMLLTDISFDFVRSEIAEVTADSWQHVCKLFAEMETEARAWLTRERVPQPEQSFRYHIDARYQGQNFEVMVAMSPGLAIDPAVDGMSAFLLEFSAAHQREYGYDVPGRAIEIVNCRLQAVGAVAKAPLREIGAGGGVNDAITSKRKVYFGSRTGWLDTPVHARAKLPAGVTLAGPALIEEMSSTVLLAPGQNASVDRIGNLVINIGRNA
jgi:N-methylhydantoinase A